MQTSGERSRVVGNIKSESIFYSERIRSQTYSVSSCSSSLSRSLLSYSLTPSCSSTLPQSSSPSPCALFSHSPWPPLLTLVSPGLPLISPLLLSLLHSSNSASCSLLPHSSPSLSLPSQSPCPCVTSPPAPTATSYGADVHRHKTLTRKCGADDHAVAGDPLLALSCPLALRSPLSSWSSLLAVFFLSLSPPHCLPRTPSRSPSHSLAVCLILSPGLPHTPLGLPHAYAHPFHALPLTLSLPISPPPAVPHSSPHVLSLSLPLHAHSCTRGRCVPFKSERLTAAAAGVCQPPPSAPSLVF